VCSVVLYSFMYCFSLCIQLSLFLFVCKFSDHSHRMETQLQSINITSYQMTPYGCSSRLGCYVSSVGKELSTKKVSDLRKVVCVNKY
jgi:hypothetical protein